MDWMSLTYGVLFMIAAQTLTWFQLQGQFIWESFAKHEWLVIIIPSLPLSFLYLYSVKFLVAGFGGVYWPSRFISFGIGVVVFSILVSTFLNEGINLKTGVSILLALGLVSVQIFWK